MKRGIIIETQDGSHSILSDQFGVSYHSKYGAIQESRHVFVAAGLYYKAAHQKKLAILEVGFGTGLNALLTLLEAEKHNWNIYYETIEAFPISIEQAQALNHPVMLNATEWQTAFLQIHESPWMEIHPITSHFTFKKIQAQFQQFQADNRFDVIYFDPFAPETQPELWETPLLQVMYEALLPKGVLVTYCAKGSVKRNLKKVGFHVESLPGPPGKREMTRAIKP